MSALQALQQWCKQQCEGYKDVHITNMTTSFRDGLAFCAILHRHRPDLINFSSLSKENVYENNHLAFQVAEEELGIPALLDAEDMVALKVPDRLSILTYVSQYYNYFHGRSPIGGMGGIKRPPSGSGDEPKGKKTVSEPVMPAHAKPSPVHLPPEPKTSLALQGRNRAKENPPLSARRVLAESTNMRSSLCAVCGGHVHLVQRLLMDGKLYHRNCFRCQQCSSTLQPGNYRAGTEPGSFICSRHEQPSRLPNSSLAATAKLVAGAKEPATSASGNNVKGLESKKTAQEPAKPNQLLRSGSSTVATAWAPSLPGDNKLNSIAPSPHSRWSGPAGNKPDHPGSPPLACWTASSAKTQQAREKFFQSGLGASDVPSGKSEAVPSHVAPSSPPQAAGKALSSGTNRSGTDSGSHERDKARSFLMNALPGPQPSTNRPGDISSTSPRLPVLNTGKISPTSPGLQHLEIKKSLRPASVPSAAEKTGKMPSKTALSTQRPSSELGKKVDVGTATQNTIKDQPITSKSAGSERKPDMKVTKVGSGSAVEEKLENPADWRSRLKPVTNKINIQDNARTSQKPVDVHKVLINITPSPAQKDKSPASSVSIPVIQDTADQPQKKKRLVPNLDLTSSWQKSRQQWEDVPATQKVEDRVLPKRTVAPVKPSTPRSFQKNPSGQVVSPSKLSPDYVPEEEIQKEVRQIEKDLDELELKGVDMEKQLRGCEGDVTEDALLVEWFKLIHEKQLLLRRESELMHKLNQQKLEAKQWDIESELRHLMGKSDFLKTPWEKAREEALLKLYIATVNDRNKIVEDLDEDRIRELEEDEMLAAMIQKLDTPRNNQESEKKKTKFGLFKILKTKH